MTGEPIDEYNFEDRSNGLIAWGTVIALAGFGWAIFSLARTGSTLIGLQPGGNATGLFASAAGDDRGLVGDS